MTAASCHAEAPRRGAPGGVVIALAGNPNVGKSTIFNSLTGLEVLTANYPGTTADASSGIVRANGRAVTLVDLPGAYGLGGPGDDQRAARAALLAERPDAMVAVVDATNLARNLTLTLQLLDLGYPVVVALNFADEAERDGITIDAEHLGELLGAPVIPTVATRRAGLDQVLAAAVHAAGRGSAPRHRHGHALEDEVARVARLIGPGPLPPRGAALLLLEHGAVAEVRGQAGDEAMREADAARRRLAERSGEDAALVIARERHAVADRIVAKVSVSPAELADRRVWRFATRPATGLPLLAAVLGIVFAGLFVGGSLLSGLVDAAWARYVSPLVRAPILWALGDGVAARTILWGVDAGLDAVLSIGLPYVLTFYAILAVLEDTGYLNAAAVLLDRVLGTIGLNGRAAIPLVAGAGCNVPAIIGLRVLRTERERLIAGTLITLVPCSARTAVIMGAVARFVSPQAAVGLYALVAAVILGAGWALNRYIPGGSPSLLMEIFPFRMPVARLVARKTWARVREFVTVAVPIVLAGSVVLGALYETGLIRWFERPFAPVVEGWLGLPAVAGLTLVFAVLRKELALQLLAALAIAQFGRGAATLAAFMSKDQIFTYALVNTIYVPCIATIAMLARALGWRRAAVISGGTVALAVLLGGVVIRVLRLIG